MRAVQIDTLGGLEVLNLRDVPDAKIGTGQVLVRTIASSLNPIDVRLRTTDRGLPMPLTLGWDLAGVVVESSVPTFQAGDRVIAMRHVLQTRAGTWADLHALPADALVKAPESGSLAEAATLPLAGVTALQALRALALSGSSHVLVTGAVGAVGALFVQLAVAEGHTVDGLVSRPNQIEHAATLGVRAATSNPKDLTPGGYDAIFDTVGCSNIGVDAADLVRPGGSYVTVTKYDMPRIPRARHLLVQPSNADLTELAKSVDDGRLQLRVAARYPVREVREAHRHFASRGLLGKVVLDF